MIFGNLVLCRRLVRRIYKFFFFLVCVIPKCLPIIIIIIIIIIGIQPLGRSRQRSDFSQATGMVLVRCILGKFLGVACHCFSPLFRCSHLSPRPPRRERSQRWKFELWARMLSGNLAEMTTSTPFRDLLHAANL